MLLIGLICALAVLSGLVASYTFFGVTLDEHGHPVSGRDADRLARWKAQDLVRHQQPEAGDDGRR